MQNATWTPPSIRYQCSREVFMSVRLQFIIWGLNGLFALISNIMAIYLLATKTKLQKNKFCMLTLCLSISSTGLSVCILFISVTILACDYDENLVIVGGCVIGFAILKGMQLCSVFQTVVICLYQYFSTFSVVNKHVMRFTSWKMVPVWHIIIITYILIIFCCFGNLSSYDCNEDVFFGSHWKIATCFTYVPLTITFLSGIVLYGMTVNRLVQNHKKKVFLVGTNDLSEKRLRQNNFTLGILIFLSVILVLPKLVALVIIPCGYDGFQMVKFVSGVVCGFKPLMDPVVYCCRIEDVRNRVKSMLCKRLNRVGNENSTIITVSPCLSKTSSSMISKIGGVVPK